MTILKQTEAGVLSISYYENGPLDGTLVILLHGFPYDVHAYDGVIPPQESPREFAEAVLSLV